MPWFLLVILTLPVEAWAGECQLAIGPETVAALGATAEPGRLTLTTAGARTLRVKRSEDGRVRIRSTAVNGPAENDAPGSVRLVVRPDGSTRLLTRSGPDLRINHPEEVVELRARRRNGLAQGEEVLDLVRGDQALDINHPEEVLELAQGEEVLDINHPEEVVEVAGRVRLDGATQSGGGYIVVVRDGKASVYRLAKGSGLVAVLVADSDGRLHTALTRRGLRTRCVTS
jgi:hypothetical protein